jgi:hypothetical protein
MYSSICVLRGLEWVVRHTPHTHGRYLIAAMTSGVSAWDANAAKMNERMEQLTVFTKSKGFPRKLRRKIETYYQSYYKEKTVVNELEVLRGLSVGLRREVTEFMLEDAKGEVRERACEGLCVRACRRAYVRRCVRVRASERASA